MGESDLKVTLVFSDKAADLLYQAVRSGAVAMSMQGNEDDAKRALALAEQIKGARRYRHGGTSRLARRRG